MPPIRRGKSRKNPMPRIKHDTFLFDYLGYEGFLKFGQESNNHDQPGVMVFVGTDSCDHIGPITKDNMLDAFLTKWNVWIPAEDLIELGRYIQQLGILSREAGPDENE